MFHLKSFIENPGTTPNAPAKIQIAADEVAELPQLPASILRLHSLRWNELIETHRFNGEHLKWHESPLLRREVARPLYSLAPPPLRSIDDRAPRTTTHYGKDHQQVPYDE